MVDGYQAHLPNFVMPLIFALSTIVANPEGPADGVVTFPLAVFDFIQGGMKECTLQCVICMVMLITDATVRFRFYFSFKMYLGQVCTSVEEPSDAKTGCSYRVYGAMF